MRSIQLALHPPPTPAIPVTNPVLQKHFGQPPGYGNGFYEKFLAKNKPRGGWAKVAYVQLVRRHVEVCGAVMGMREVERGESMAQRIIMYPREWDRKVEGGEDSGYGEDEMRSRETSRRLLRKAAKEYRVMLQAVESIPVVEGSGDLTEEERYPLTNLLSLVHYNRILSLQPSGLILDSTPLDLLFTLPMEKPLLGLSAPNDESMQAAILLFEPSKETLKEITSTLPEGAYPDSEFLQRVPGTPAPVDGEGPMTLLAQTSGLSDVDAQFDAAQFLDTTAYIRLSESDLPGPEYDIPREDYVRAMPRSRQARKAWEGVYERFRDARMGTCGLDLEPVESYGVAMRGVRFAGENVETHGKRVGEVGRQKVQVDAEASDPRE